LAIYSDRRFGLFTFSKYYRVSTHIWGHLKKSLLSYRRQIKSRGEEKNEEACIELAKKLWKLRWSLLKKPSHLSVEDKQAMAELESEDEGCVHRFRNIIGQLVNIFAHAHSAAPAKLRLQQLRQDIQALEDHHLDKIPQFFDDHWDQAWRYLRKKGMGKHRRGSNSESGRRGIHVKRDTLLSIASSAELILPISATLQSTERHQGIMGQERCHFQRDS
jgi:hypothetical protein